MLLEQGRDYELYIFFVPQTQEAILLHEQTFVSGTKTKMPIFFLQRGKKYSFPRHLQIIANRDDRLSSYIAALTEKRYRLKSTREALFPDFQMTQIKIGDKKAGFFIIAIRMHLDNGI